MPTLTPRSESSRTATQVTARAPNVASLGEGVKTLTELDEVLYTTAYIYPGASTYPGSTSYPGRYGPTTGIPMTALSERAPALTSLAER